MTKRIFEELQESIRNQKHSRWFNIPELTSQIITTDNEDKKSSTIRNIFKMSRIKVDKKKYQTAKKERIKQSQSPQNSQNSTEKEFKEYYFSDTSEDSEEDTVYDQLGKKQKN